jgi:hypothetical protein
MSEGDGLTPPLNHPPFTFVIKKKEQQIVKQLEKKREEKKE